MKLAVLKIDNQTFKLAYKQDQEQAQKLKNNCEYVFTVKRARNIKHHRKFFAVLQCVIANTDYYDTVDDLLYALKLELRYYKKCRLMSTDKFVCMPESINFESMNQDQFEIFYGKALQVLSKFLGCTVEQLETNSKEYL